MAWNTTHGNHGYDNRIDSMKSIFYATGPQLKENFTLSNTSTLYNVDIFALMCVILNVDKCPPSNSSWTNIQSFLMDPNQISNFIDKETEKFHDGVMGLVIYLLGKTILVEKHEDLIVSFSPSQFCSHSYHGCCLDSCFLSKCFRYSSCNSSRCNDNS